MADKYELSPSQIARIARREKWKELRDEARRKSDAKATQKTANLAAENATISERIRGKLLQRLERAVDALPDSFGSETSKKIIKKEKDRQVIMSEVIKLRDYVSAWSDLTNSDIKREKLELEKKRIEEESW